jgi:transposase
LAEAVLASVRQILPEALQPVAPRTAGIGLQPQTLLAVLTYCYARKIYGSQDIELCMCEDAQFRRLCQNEFPRWPALRRFRRYNREALQRCLEQTLSTSAMPAADSAQIAEEAAARIQIASWIDSEAADD